MKRDRGVLASLMLAGRLRSGLTQEELAERAGVSIRTIRNLEGGQVRRPRAHTVRLLAGAMKAGDGETARMIAAAAPAYLHADPCGCDAWFLRPGTPSCLAGN